MTNNIMNEKKQANTFISEDGRVIFSYKKDWICKEIDYGIRVDCYPKSRKEEETDLGLDQTTVFYPDVSISVEDCSASKKSIPQYEKDPDMMDIYYFIKAFNGCSVLINTEDEKTDTEEKLDAIIFKASPENVKNLKEWKSYTNKEYGFTFNYPATLGPNELGISQKENLFLIEGLNEIGIGMVLPITIGLNIESEDDINSFIKEKYGDVCEFLEVVQEPNKMGLYPVSFRITDGNGGCWINWITLLLYSPEKKKIVAIDLGQEPPLLEMLDGEEIDYNDMMVESFQFISAGRDD